MFEEKAVFEQIERLLDGVCDSYGLGINVPVKLDHLMELTKAKLTLDTLKYRLRDCSPFGEIDVLQEMHLMKKEEK